MPITAGSISANTLVEQRIGVRVHHEPQPVFVGQRLLRGRRGVGAHALEEALLVRLGEVQDEQRLAQAPGGVRALHLGVEPAEQLVRLGAIRVLAQDRLL